MRFAYSNLLLLSGVAVAYELPSSKSIGGDLPDIVKAYQKAKPGALPPPFDTPLTASIVKNTEAAPDIASKPTTPTFDGLRDSFSNSRNADESSLRENLDSIQASVQSMKASIAASKEMLQQSLDGSSQSSSDALADAMQKTSSAVMDANTDAAQLMSTSVTSMRESLLQVQASLEDVIASAPQSLPVASDAEMLALADNINAGVDSLQATVQGGSAGMLDLSLGKYEQGIQSMKQAGAASMESLNALAQQVADLSQQTGTASKESLNALSQQISELSQQTSTASRESLNALSQQISDLSQQSSAASMGTLNAMSQQIADLSQQLTSFVQTSTAAANTNNAVVMDSEMLRQFQTKAGAMWSTTYETFAWGSDATMTITSVIGDFAAISALLVAAASKETGKNIALEKIVQEGKERKLRMLSLKEEMQVMSAEIVSLNDVVVSLKAEIGEAEEKLRRQRFKIGLERDALAIKLKALRRRMYRMKGRLEQKEEKAEELELQVLETKKWNLEALALLSEVNKELRSHISKKPKQRTHHEGALREQPYFLNPLQRTSENSYVPSFAFQLLEL